MMLTKQQLSWLSSLVVTLVCVGGCSNQDDPAVMVSTPVDRVAKAADIRTGTTRTNAQGDLEAFDAEQNKWLDPVAFWLSHAESRDGLTWGRSATYPTYSEVKERDLLLIEVESGVCLMEFWHRRWRRAQDVRRWSEAFNAYGGCPDVFR